MTALISYQFEEEPVRVVMIGGAPWFVAGDLAKALGYSHTPHMLRNLHEDEKGVHIADTLGGAQEMNIVSESGMYAAIFKSRRTEAERFRKWVTADVLPSIRRTGRYELPGHEPPPQDLALDHDPNRLSASVAVVREARRLFGPIGARDVWMQLGLPQPLADAEGSHDGDAWASAVKDWLAGQVETTATDVANAIGVEADFMARRRIRALLKLFGWEEKTVRRGGTLTKRWLPLHVVEG